MQKFRLTAIVFALLAALLLGACNSHPVNKKIHMAIEGTWQGSTSGVLLTIYSDGRFVLENAKNSSGTLIDGKLDRGQDQIYVVYTSPRSLCSDDAGIYRLSRKGNLLTMETLKEDCPARAAQLDKSWTLKERTPRPYKNQQ